MGHGASMQTEWKLLVGLPQGQLELDGCNLTWNSVEGALKREMEGEARVRIAWSRAAQSRMNTAGTTAAHCPVSQYLSLKMHRTILAFPQKFPLIGRFCMSPRPLRMACLPRSVSINGWMKLTSEVPRPRAWAPPSRALPGQELLVPNHTNNRLTVCPRPGFCSQ